MIHHHKEHCDTLYQVNMIVPGRLTQSPLLHEPSLPLWPFSQINSRKPESVTGLRPLLLYCFPLLDVRQSARPPASFHCHLPNARFACGTRTGNRFYSGDKIVRVRRIRAFLSYYFWKNKSRPSNSERFHSFVTYAYIPREKKETCPQSNGFPPPIRLASIILPHLFQKAGNRFRPPASASKLCDFPPLERVSF